MLSRVAESLYWTARYVERAEDIDAARSTSTTTRSSTPHVSDHGEAWQQLVALLGDTAAFREHFDAFTAHDVADWLLWHDGEPERGRELHHGGAGERPLGARADLRRDVGGDQLPVPPRRPRQQERRRSRPARVLRAAPERRAPLPGLRRRDDDPRRAVRVHPARPPPRAAVDDVRVVRSRYPVAVSLANDDPAQAHELIALLKSCSAFEAYVAPRGDVRAARHRRIARPLGAVPPLGCSTACGPARPPSTGSPAEQAPRTACSAASAQRSSTATSTTSPVAASPRRWAGSSAGSTGPVTR